LRLGIHRTCFSYELISVTPASIQLFPVRLGRDARRKLLGAHGNAVQSVESHRRYVDDMRYLRADLPSADERLLCHVVFCSQAKRFRTIVDPPLGGSELIPEFGGCGVARAAPAPDLLSLRQSGSRNGRPTFDSLLTPYPPS
jgi:hypothetical protein